MPPVHNAQLPPADAAWLQAHGATDVRVGADGVIEFSARDARRDVERGMVALARLARE